MGYAGRPEQGLAPQEMKMSKYGRGLNREVVAAVNTGFLSEPFSTKDVRKVIRHEGWRPEPSQKYVNVALANGASNEHSITYGKYFLSLGDGRYKLRPEYKGSNRR
jgi:hypothetical protein